MSSDQWGTLVTGLAGFAFVLMTIVALVLRKWRLAGYLAVTAYVLLWPVHLWFWQFELTRRAPLPRWYFWSAVQQVVIGGIVPLIWFCFHRFRPLRTALFLVYVLSLVLQLFSYMYWSYGNTRNFNISLSHLDSFYVALGTLSTAGTGNISAISETSRGLQTLQMGLDLVLIGFVITLILARYSNLIDRSRGGLPHENEVAARPTTSVTRDSPEHGSLADNSHSDPDISPQSDAKDRHTRNGGDERRVAAAAQPDADDAGRDDGKRLTSIPGQRLEDLYMAARLARIQCFCW